MEAGRVAPVVVNVAANAAPALPPLPRAGVTHAYTLREKRAIVLNIKAEVITSVCEESFATNAVQLHRCPPYKQSQAARMYNVDRKTIFRWRQEEPFAKINVDLSKKTAHPGRPVTYAELEAEMFEWVVQQRREGQGKLLWGCVPVAVLTAAINCSNQHW